MILARVVGNVVATRKDPRLEGKKLLIIRPVSPDGKEEYRIGYDTAQLLGGFLDPVFTARGRG